MTVTATNPRPKTPKPIVDERQRAADAELVKKNADPTGQEAARYQRLELVKDAIAAEGIALPNHIEALIVERTQQWNSSLRPANVLECWMAELVAKMSLSIEEYDKMLKYQISIRSRRAEMVELWRAECRAEVAELADDFASQWTVLLPKLKTTTAGIEWLLSRWVELADTFDARGNLTAAQRLLAVKLQGRPLEILMTDPVQNGSTAGEELRGVLDAEIAGLRSSLAGGLFHIDEIDRLAVVTGQKLDDSAEAKSIRKLRAQSVTLLKWATAQFKQGRFDHDPSAKKPSSPISPPFHVPEPASPPPPLAPRLEPAADQAVKPAATAPLAKAASFWTATARKALASTKASFSALNKSSISSSSKPLTREERDQERHARAHRQTSRAKGRPALA